MTEETLVNDIVESDKVLDYDEPQPIDFWMQKHREVVISTVDYTLGNLANMVLDGTIDLAPAYQRRERWNVIKKSRLIESFLMNLPVPPIFLDEDAQGNFSVIDGKQRLLAISEFINGTLELKGLNAFADANGMRFSDLPPRYRRVVESRTTLRTIIVLRPSDEDVKYEVFRRVNTGGVPLNRQEIRNATFTGPLNDMILDVSEYEEFHKLLGIENKEKSRIYKSMRDAEFVLRYLTFRDNWRSFPGPLGGNMDAFMDDNRRMEEVSLNDARSDFLHVIGVVHACFGQYAFRRWNPEKDQWSNGVLAALYDAQMFGCMEISAEKALPNQDKIVKGMMKLFKDEDFNTYITVSTNSPTHFQNRIKMVKRMLHRIVK